MELRRDRTVLVMMDSSEKLSVRGVTFPGLHDRGCMGDRACEWLPLYSKRLLKESGD